MYAERRQITLGEFGHCIYCFRGPRNLDPSGTYLSIDHIIPRIAGKDHPYLLTRVIKSDKHEDLENLINDPCNLRVMCRQDHNKFDNYDGKSKSYRLAGLIGIVHNLANEPLPLGELERTTYLWQRHELFRLFQIRLNNVLADDSVGLVTSKQKSHYEATLSFVNLTLFNWKNKRLASDFYVPPLARFDAIRRHLAARPMPTDIGTCARFKGSFDSFPQS